ncbi:MAG TPA: DUF1707 domain-containing protein [Stackebrandtia sp.]|jgi:hypothetical protein|uniref:DUF1707 SHOCT-like domain-containing protein n=1 Tax=Stackebrandtia sp. TaxID=2023065 RepID=UPI002D64B1FF|nr:DUF1707 domain-containing protein [Stackebrandtia sp.]HZE41639.1 DUF1707 domain-containing protein [Stackebrandtia sp.]
MSELERARIRVSNGDRDRVINQLQESTAEGRLTLDEFAARVDVVYAAKTFGDLVPVTEDLPESRGDVTDFTQDSTMTLNPTGSSVRRLGRWLVPRTLILRPHGCGLRIDFRDAVIPHRQVDIELDVHGSGVKLIMPPDAVVEDNVDMTGSSFRNKVTAGYGSDNGVRFVVRGSISGSSVRIVRKRRRRWWRRRR